MRKAQADPVNDATASHLGSFVQLISERSVAEIESLIAAFECMRDFIQNESERIQREIAGFACVNETTMRSISEVNATLVPWETAIDNGCDRPR